MTEDRRPEPRISSAVLPRLAAAREHIARRGYAEAIRELNAALEHDPRSALARFLLGRAFALTGRWERSAEAFRAAIENDPALAAAHLGLAYALIELGRCAEAARAARKAVELSPLLSFAHSLLASALDQDGRSDEAIAAYRGAVRIAPLDSAPRYRLARLLLRQGRLPEAVHECLEAARLRPPEPVVASAGTKDKDEDSATIDGSRDGPESAAADDPTAGEAHYEAAESLLRRGELTRALSEFRKAHSRGVRKPACLRAIGEILYNQGRLHEALASCLEALALEPGRAEIGADLERVLEAIARRERAEQETDFPLDGDGSAALEGSGGRASRSGLVRDE